MVQAKEIQTLSPFTLVDLLNQMTLSRSRV